MKKRSNAVVTMEQSGNDLTFTVLGAGAIKLDMGKLNEAILTRAAIHGLKQRISDAAAIPCDPETGKPASPEEKFEAMARLVNHYMTGTADWNLVRAAGEPRESGGKTLQAMMNVYGFASLDKAREVVQKTADKQGITYEKAMATWRNSDKIAAELIRMKAENSSIDADELLKDIEA
jgi:hypothetical protein